MSEMVEPVARAMFHRFFEVGLKLGISGGPTPWEEAFPEWREAWLETVRAGIEAMREPTEGMCEAGQQINNIAPESAGLNAFEYLSRNEMAEAWQAMIDAALK